MKRMTLSKTIAAAAGITLMLAGCGGDPEQNAQIPPVEATPTVTEVTPEPDPEPTVDPSEVTGAAGSIIGAIPPVPEVPEETPEEPGQEAGQTDGGSKSSEKPASKPKSDSKSSSSGSTKPKTEPKPKQTTQAPKPKPSPTTQAPKPKPTTPAPKPEKRVIKKWDTVQGETQKLLNARAAEGKHNAPSDYYCAPFGTVRSLDGASGILGSAAHRNIVMNSTYARLVNPREIIQETDDAIAYHYEVDVHNCVKLDD